MFCKRENECGTAIPRRSSPAGAATKAKRLFLWVLRWDVRVAGSGGFEVGGDVGVDVAHGPASAAGEKIQEKFILPVFWAIADVGVENAALAVQARPGAGIGAALIALAFEFAGV